MSSGNLFALAFDNLRDGALLLEKSTGRVVEANAAFLRICGLARHEVVGRNFWAPPLTSHAEAGSEILARLRASGRLEETGLPLKTAAGDVLLLAVSGRELAGDMVQLEVRDATSRAGIRTAERMDAQRTLAARAATEFAALSDALANQETDRVWQSAARAAEVARELRAYSRESKPEVKPLRINDLISAVRPEIERMMGLDTNVVTNLAENLSPVLADAAFLQQIILELAANSRDAMKQGGKFHVETRHAPPADPSLGPPGAAGGPYAVLEIRDEGPGFDDQSWEHLFEPFFTTKTPDRLGLGLAAMHGAVHQMQGRLWVDSEPGKGATFRIYLPLTDVEPAVQGPATILLVEQNDGLRTVIANILQKHGYRVLAAAASAEGLELARAAAPPDLLIIEPEPELTETLTARHPRLRTLFLNGRTSYPGAPAIDQPFDVQTLLAKIKELLQP